MTNYELMLIIDPSLSEEENKSALDTIRGVLTGESAKIVKEDIWGDRKLAYKINGSDRWFYVLLDLELKGESIEKINGVFNLNQNLWRYMFVKKGS